MEHPERLEESQSDDGRYRLLIEAVTDYAIYMLDPTGIARAPPLPGAPKEKPKAS